MGNTEQLVWVIERFEKLRIQEIGILLYLFIRVSLCDLFAEK